ncbi:hypothetical protein PVW47_18610 [Marinovum sp. SP66]|nr:hypothetical protein [Marinovum sp. SP66]MDD9741801.1 hypothetical protein [Marinovum sp. SP66]
MKTCEKIGAEPAPAALDQAWACSTPETLPASDARVSSAAPVA